jgi:DNA-binding CsgD family transcriptional regulator
VTCARVDFNQLLDLLYGATTDPAYWAEFLKGLSFAANATNCGLLLNESKNEKYKVAVNFGFHPEAPRMYAEYYGALDEYIRGGRGLLHAGWVGTSQHLVNDRDLLRSEFYNDYQKQFDMFYQCGAIIDMSAHRVTALTLLRPRKSGPFKEKQVSLLRRLAPHLRRACSMHELLVDLRTHNQGMQMALDELAQGVLFLDDARKVIMANKAALARVLNNGALRLVADRLCAADAYQNQLLQAAIANAIGGKAELPDFIKIVAASGESCHVACTRLRSSVQSRIAAVVVIASANEDGLSAKRALAVIYRLTPAEIRLAMGISEGNNLKTVADTLNISLNTAKTQLSNVYGKTATSRQAQLVRLIGSLPHLFPFGESYSVAQLGDDRADRRRPKSTRKNLRRRVS